MTIPLIDPFPLSRMLPDETDRGVECHAIKPFAGIGVFLQSGERRLSIRTLLGHDLTGYCARIILSQAIPRDVGDGGRSGCREETVTQDAAKSGMGVWIFITLIESISQVFRLKGCALRRH